MGLCLRTLLDALLIELAQPPGAFVLLSAVNVLNTTEIVEARQLRIKAVDNEVGTFASAPRALLQAGDETGARLCIVAQLFGSLSEIPDAPALPRRDRGS